MGELALRLPGEVRSLPTERQEYVSPPIGRLALRTLEGLLFDGHADVGTDGDDFTFRQGTNGAIDHNGVVIRLREADKAVELAVRTRLDNSIEAAAVQVQFGERTETWVYPPQEDQPNTLSARQVAKIIHKSKRKLKKAA